MQINTIGTDGYDMGLGWLIAKSAEAELIRHGGGTGGYRSFVGFMPKSRIGVVALSNASTNAGIGDIGQHLLNRELPLWTPPKQRVAIEIDPMFYDRYVGRYRLRPDFILDVRREGNRLFIQATGQELLEILPESEREFFCTSVDAQITFEMSGDGHPASLTLHQNDRNTPAPRVDA